MPDETQSITYCIGNLLSQPVMCVCFCTCVLQFVSELLFEGFTLKRQIRGGRSHMFYPHADPCCFTDHMIQPEVSGLPFSYSLLKPHTFLICLQVLIEFSSRWVCINIILNIYIYIVIDVFFFFKPLRFGLFKYFSGFVPVQKKPLKIEGCFLFFIII